MLNFPDSPAVDETFEGPSGQLWKWDGVKWKFGSVGGGDAGKGPSLGPFWGTAIKQGDDTYSDSHYELSLDPTFELVDGVTIYFMVDTTNLTFIGYNVFLSVDGQHYSALLRRNLKALHKLDLQPFVYYGAVYQEASDSWYIITPLQLTFSSDVDVGNWSFIDTSGYTSANIYLTDVMTFGLTHATIIVEEGVPFFITIDDGGAGLWYTLEFQDTDFNPVPVTLSQSSGVNGAALTGNFPSGTVTGNMNYTHRFSCSGYLTRWTFDPNAKRIYLKT